jgi:hypothetical protein
MAYEIVLEEVAARPLAAVHASVPVGHVALAWRPALDKVWAFLRVHEDLRTNGHNIFVYHHPVRPGAPLDVDFGVELAGANAAIEEWCRANQRPLAGISWEIYGDPGDDPAQFEVRVFYLLG